MNQVTTCPNTLEEVTSASTRLGCRTDRFGKIQYMCIPNVEKTSLFEFCHGGIMGINEKGNCLEVNTIDATLSTKSCTDFRSGCPEDHFWSHQFYMYPDCQDINPEKQCYKSQPSCTSVDDVGDESLFYPNILIGVLVPFLVLIGVVIFIVRKRRKRDKKVSYKDKEPDMEQNIELITRREVPYKDKEPEKKNELITSMSADGEDSSRKIRHRRRREVPYKDKEPKKKQKIELITSMNAKREDSYWKIRHRGRTRFNFFKFTRRNRELRKKHRRPSC